MGVYLPDCPTCFIFKMSLQIYKNVLTNYFFFFYNILVNKTRANRPKEIKMFYYLVKVNGQKCVAAKSFKEARYYYETLVNIGVVNYDKR